MSSFWLNFIVQLASAALNILIQHPEVTSHSKDTVYKLGIGRVS